MPRTHPPYAPEYRRRLIELARAGRSIDQLAREFGVTTATITNYLAAMRRDLRGIVLERLREITSGEREFRNEARALLGIRV